MQIYYSLSEPAAKVTFKILDIEGKTLSQLSGSTKAGLNKVVWDMTRPLETAKVEAGGKGKKGGGGFGQGRRLAAPGEYRVVMTVDDVEKSQVLRLEGDPNAPPGRRVADEEEIVPPSMNDY